METTISQLVEYGVRRGWIGEEDRIWAANRILHALQLDGFGGVVPVGDLPDIQVILDTLCEDACRRGVIGGRSAAFFDLLDTELMGLLVPRPSEVIACFREKYEISPREATDWYYRFSGDTNYIRRDRIAKDMIWQADTEYGRLDITINLSKPEKDPKAIAAAASVKSSGYPKCLLCMENEGYAGSLSHPARQNHRMIPLHLPGGNYFLQYSPYVYYNEHCIVLNREHIPMKIDRKTIENLLEFITQFPHYFLGSNADLPIVGGSVLSHDHYQGGCYEFAMARAETESAFVIPGYEDVKAGIVKWPMSVVRLRGMNRERLTDLAVHILETWRDYDDPEAGIFHETDHQPHNTITPIARRRGEEYELDLVLRNNRTSEEHPLGIFHPHREKHHIKKENIGLIEVMGLAVLPARLKTELSAVAEKMVQGRELEGDPGTASHAAWAEEVRTRHPEMDASNAMDILCQEVGKVFSQVLEDAGVFKRTDEGKRHFLQFVNSL